MKKMNNSCVCLLERAARLYGEKTAFEDKDSSVTFELLRKRSRSAAAYLLKNCETGRLKPIVVYLPKSIASIVCFMGAMYAGSPYVPIDYAIPMARLKRTEEKLVPSAVITDREGMARLEEAKINTKIILTEDLFAYAADDAAVDAALAAVCDLDCAYIMYTSGSTGTPKGVTVSHRGVIDYTLWLAETFPIDGESIIGMQSAFHFDNSVFDMYLTLYTGAKTMIIPEILFMYPEKLTEYLEQTEISVIFWVPTVMISVANARVLDTARLEKLKLILFAGEVMPNTQLNYWREKLPGCMYVNMYGPTEATDIAAYYIVDREYENHETLPIGKPCANMKTIILDENNNPCPEGVQGELCIGGSGIASGYWNLSDITESVFVQNPLNTKYMEKIYRTGDLAYVNGEGNIIFVGRADSQIKLRGNRIELGEIESAASAMDGIDNCCAMFDAEKQEIVLFLETHEVIVPRKFNMGLKRYIPSYMVPSRIITTDKFPHTPSGKIDRRKLKKEYF